MKNISNLVYYTLICITLVGCSITRNNSTLSENTDLKASPSAYATPSLPSVAPSVTPSGKNSTQIIITLGGKSFDLNKPFEEAQLNNLSSEDLAILRNSIYAKHGYVFSEKKYSDYFSGFSWYKPAGKNAEEKFNDTDNKNVASIVSIESKKDTAVKSSNENKNYIEAGKADLTLNGTKETLYITSENLPSNLGNKPKRITLKVKDSETVFESKWNDSLSVSTADFDNTDSDIDIYIIEQGTDTGSTIYIYKFDGSKIYFYDKFRDYQGTFLYDGKGNLYYWYQTQNKEVNKFYNYRVKQSGNITDEKLKASLNKLF